MSFRTNVHTLPRKERRKTRRELRQEARRTRHTARYMAAWTAQGRLEAAWDHLRAVVAERGEAAAHEAAEAIHRTAERLDKRTRK